MLIAYAATTGRIAESHTGDTVRKSLSFLTACRRDTARE